MSEHKLTLELRTLTGKKLASLRANDMIPSVIYGGKEPILTSSIYNDTEKVLRAAGYHSPVDLMLDGKKKLAIVKNLDTDLVSKKIINIEFQAISAREAVEAAAPIAIVNFEESDASKLTHFELNQLISEVTVKAKPAALPKELTIDAAKLVTLEDKLTLSDIALPEGVEYADKEIDLAQVVANVYDPAAEAAAREAKEAAEAEAATESTEASTKEPVVEEAKEEAPAEESAE